MEFTKFVHTNFDPRSTPYLSLMSFNHRKDLQNNDNGGFSFELLVDDPKPTNDDDNIVIPKLLFKKLKISHNWEHSLNFAKLMLRYSLNG